MRKRLAASVSAAVLILTLSAALIACGNDDDAGADAASTDGPIRVLGSTSIIADWIEQVGGDNVEVDSIVPMGTDVHAFVVAPGDIRKIGDADLIFMVGEHLESGFESEIRANAAGEVVALAKGMTLQRFPDTHQHEHDDDHAHDDDHSHDDDDHARGDDHSHDDDDDHARGDDHGHDEGDGHEDDGHGHEGDDGHAHGDFDPHIWMDIDLSIQAVERIRDTLTEMDPDNASAYEERADAYIATLRELDDEIAEMLSGMDESRRYIVTFHDAYGYFATRYGLTLLGFVVENPEEQPSAARYARLVDEIEEHEVRYIYTEPQFDARVVEQLARDTGTELRTIPSDALSDETPDYVSLMRTIAAGIADE